LGLGIKSIFSLQIPQVPISIVKQKRFNRVIATQGLYTRFDTAIANRVKYICQPASSVDTSEFAHVVTSFWGEVSSQSTGKDLS
jgi:hypothetical protein